KELQDHQRAALIVFAGRPKVLRPLASDPIEIDDAAAEGLSLRDQLLHRSAKEEAKKALLEIERNLSGDDAQARLEKARQRLARIEAFEAELGTGETDVREALRLARSVLPEDSRRR